VGFAYNAGGTISVLTKMAYRCNCNLLIETLYADKHRWGDIRRVWDSVGQRFEDLVGAARERLGLLLRCFHALGGGISLVEKITARIRCRLTSAVFHNAKTPPTALFKGGNASADSRRAVRDVKAISLQAAEPCQLRGFHLSGGSRIDHFSFKLATAKLSLAMLAESERSLLSQKGRLKNGERHAGIYPILVTASL
jgi:hypothetical protein